MNIFQEELKRKLPNLECEGMYDEEHNIFSIMHITFWLKIYIRALIH